MKKLGHYLPIDRKFDYLFTTGLATASLVPGIGLIPQGFHQLANIGYAVAPENLVINASCAGAALILGPFVWSRGTMVFGSATDISLPAHEIVVCGMPCREDALFTGMLILGSTGSGKTSSAILPALDQIFKKYNHPGNDSKDTLLNIGGFCLDAKMEFYEPILSFMHDAGRNILEDACVVRPNCFIPVGVFEDPDTGMHFHLPAQSYSNGSEVERLISSDERTAGLGILPNFLMKRTDDRIQSEKLLKDLVFDVGKLDLHFLGWRRAGDTLHPLKSIASMRESAVDKGQSISAPKRLRYKEMSGIDTGIRYNIVNNRVSSAVAGKRLANIASLVDGGEGGKKDPYWDKQAANLFTQVMDAWILLDAAQASNLFPLSKDGFHTPTVRRDLGGPDILRIVEHADVQEGLIRELKSKRDKLSQEALAQTGRNRMLEREAKARHRKCDDLIKFFETTWKTLAPNTKSIIESCVRNMFGTFAQDDNLAESFCSPATISFDEMVTRGRFFFFVAGYDYRDLAKVMGTALKLDAHSTVLSRPSRAELKKNRRLLEVIDECQQYAVAGEGGDQETKNMSRASKFFHINATQSEVSLEEVVGHNHYGTYIQAYGVRVTYNLMDPKSRKEAANLSGQVWREKKEVVADDLTYEHVLGLKGNSGQKDHTRYEKELKFSEHVYLELDTHESITYNKDRRTLKGENKVHRQMNVPHPIGAPSSRAAFEEFLREYARCYAEYCAQNKKWNPDGMGAFHIGNKTRPTPPPQPPQPPSTPPPPQPAPKTPTTPNTPAPTPKPPVTTPTPLPTQNAPSTPKSSTPQKSQPQSSPPQSSTSTPQTTPPKTSNPVPTSQVPEQVTPPPPVGDSSNTNAFNVRDPGANETGAKTPKTPRASKRVIQPPPPELLGKTSEVKADTPAPAPRPSATPNNNTPPTLESATARFANGVATPADLEVINLWSLKPENQTALLSAYFDDINVPGIEIVATQDIAQMSEGGGDPTSIHRGTRGVSQGTPKGRGSQPGTPELGLSGDSLDLSPTAKSEAESLVAASEKANTEARAKQPSFSIDDLRKKWLLP